MSIVSDPNNICMLFKKDDFKIDEKLFGDGVYLANLNSNRQVVICGLRDKLIEFKEQNPIEKFILLNVSAPFHSDLMVKSAGFLVKKLKIIYLKKLSLI